jgi:CheY-like chemotaxis protein
MISSQVGRGTIVKVYLPRFQNAAPLGEAEDIQAAIPAGGGERILVIEDEPPVRSVVVETLGDLGYSVIAASDGLEGLAILQSLQRIDLLVTDVGLPGLNGRQVADAARLVRPRLKILFMTGYEGAAAVPARTLDADMSLITKPFAVEALAARVRGLLTGEDAH